jgi:hypothetical protein
MFTDVIFDSPSKDLDDGFETIDLVLEFFAIPNPQTRLLPILIHTDTVVASTPPATWLIAITFDLSCLAEFAAV